MDNPKKAIDAIVSPAPLTLGQVALLDRLNSPLLRGDTSSLFECGKSLWALSMPRKEAAEKIGDADKLSVLWMDSLSPQEYRKRLGNALDAIAAFYDLLPRAESGKKKDSATDGSPSLSNGPAGHTDGGQMK